MENEIVPLNERWVVKSALAVIPRAGINKAGMEISVENYVRHETPL